MVGNHALGESPAALFFSMPLYRPPFSVTVPDRYSIGPQGGGDEPAGKKLPDPADSSRDTLGAETYQGGRHCHGDVDGTVASFVQSSSCSHPQMP